MVSGGHLLVHYCSTHLQPPITTDRAQIHPQYRSYPQRLSNLRTVCSTPRARATPPCSSPRSTRGFLPISQMKKARRRFPNWHSESYLIALSTPYLTFSQTTFSSASRTHDKKKRQHALDARGIRRPRRARAWPGGAWGGPEPPERSWAGANRGRCVQ